MASLLGILLDFFRGLRPTKNHIKRFLKRWTFLFAYLVRKMSEWRFLLPTKPGTIRNPKPAESSFTSGREGSSSVSGGSVCTGGIGGYVVAASTVPASAKQSLGREPADPPSDTAPPTPTLATPVDLPSALCPSTTNQIVGSNHAYHSSASLSVQSRASDRLSMVSISPISLRALAQTDRPSQDPRATYRHFGPYLGASRSRTRSRSSRPHSESLPTTSINAPEITAEPLAIDTSTHMPLHISPSDRAETASLNPHTISSVASVLALPEGRTLQLINSDEIPRYTKSATM